MLEFYLYVPGVGPLNSLFCLGGGFLYTMIVLGGWFLLPSSRVPGICPGGMVLDETDSCIRPCCQSFQKHPYFPREYFLIIMIGVQYKGFYLE